MCENPGSDMAADGFFVKVYIGPTEDIDKRQGCLPHV